VLSWPTIIPSCERLSHYADVEVVGEAQDGTEALACVENLRPDVVLMDVAMPGMGGIEATQLIRGQHSMSRVLVLTQYDDWQYIKPLLEAGASGYITKRTLGTDLITAIRVVARGETFLQPNVASTVALQIRTHATPDVPATERLTAREREVLKHIALGKTNPQIALALSISVKTVDWHRTNLMSKLDLHSIADLVRYALQHGLVDETS